MSKLPRPIRIPAPGLRRSIGLGQAIKHLTTALGVRPCGGCGQRAISLDRRVVLTPMRRK
ncbi:MAG TPA: hypothetical protein VF881_18380 [Polyangiaceae bacterium]